MKAWIPCSDGSVIASLDKTGRILSFSALHKLDIFGIIRSLLPGGPEEAHSPH